MALEVEEKLEESFASNKQLIECPRRRSNLTE